MSEVDPPGYPENGREAPAWVFPTTYGPVATPQSPTRHRPQLWIILLVTLFVMVAIGVTRLGWPAASTSSAWAPSSASPAALAPAAAPPWAPATAPQPATPAGASNPTLDLSALTAAVDPAVVDINTRLSDPNGQGAGTGIVLSPSGEVLTNNHVINGATSISATDVGNGQTYPATVVGYDRSHDIAVLQLQGASGLRAASIGDSNGVAIGDQIAAIGNAGGRGGTPSVAAGKVSALDQAATVSDETTASAEQLAGLIQVAADVVPGDSGGPLVNTAGQVIGIDTAGSAGSRWQPSGSVGLAIPINDAVAISRQIQAGTTSAAVHIGPTGILGVLVQDPTSQSAPGHRAKVGSRHRSDTPGALVAGVTPGSPAERSGLSAGDTIVSLNTAIVDSPATLTTLLTGHHPGDPLRLTWVNASGQQQTATLRLATGPPN